jgi:hypothetical protein
MLPQELEQLGTRAPPGQTGRTTMTRRATIRKQMRRRLALIEILGMGRRTGECINRAEDKQTAPQFWLRHELL